MKLCHAEQTSPSQHSADGSLTISGYEPGGFLFTHIGTLRSQPLLLAFEELHLLFMLFCGFTRIERAEVSALPRFGILLFGVEAVFAGF